MWDWLDAQKEYFAVLGVVSAVMFVGSALLVPWVVLRIPTDALNRPNPLDALGQRHPVLRVLVFLGRNLIGIPLLLAGVVMLVTPGQGILTILLALIVMEVPGKWKLEHQLLGRPGVLRVLNWIRRKGHRAPFDAYRSRSNDP